MIDQSLRKVERLLYRTADDTARAEVPYESESVRRDKQRVVVRQDRQVATLFETDVKRIESEAPARRRRNCDECAPTL